MAGARELRRARAIRHVTAVVFTALLGSPLVASQAGNRSGDRLRVIIETDAGGDPDDEQSLVRFLLYTNEWDVEGIVVTRAEARDGENLNTERTGLGIVRRQLQAYRECYPSLRLHDRRFPSSDLLWRRTVPSYGGTHAAERLILEAVDRRDPRPVWFCNWGTDEGSEGSSLKRVLDRVLKERGPDGYARFKRRLRLSSDDQFGEHTKSLEPPFPLWVDTFRPERDRRRWYHRFSALTATAGGFDVRRDVLTGHGPLGALYPTNTTHPQKEGDTMTFLYLVPTGMNDPEHPGWGSWAGRYGPNERWPGRPYYWANQEDTWNGTTSRDNTVARWSAALQNDFRARLDWCVRDYAHANHPPRPRVRGSLFRTVRAGEIVRLDPSASDDPDRDPVRFEWSFYPEAGAYRGELPLFREGGAGKTSFTAPEVERPAALHVLLAVADSGSPPLTRYRRIVVNVLPRSRGKE